MLIQTILDEFNSYFAQSADHDTILWFDPREEWKGLLPHLEAHFHLLVFGGSQLQLRYQLAKRQQGERAVVYLPLEKEEARFLRPYFCTSKCHQGSIERVLRDCGIVLSGELRQRKSLLPFLATASVGKGREFWDGIVNLKTALDRLIVDPDDTLLRLLANTQRSVVELNQQGLAEPFLEMVAAEFGIDLPEPGQEEAWANRFTAHLCLVEAYASAQQAQGFPFREVLPEPVYWDRCRGFLHQWQHHELFKSAFRKRARAIDGEYPLGSWAVGQSVLPGGGTFLNVEKHLWQKTQVELEAIDSKLEAINFCRQRHRVFQERADGFWARENEVPGWRAVAGMAQVVIGAQDALDELDEHATAAAAIERYASEWWKVDSSYRRFRTDVDRGHEQLDAALKWANRIYGDFLEQVNSRFTEAIDSDEVWPPDGQRFGTPALWDEPSAESEGLRALIMVDALRYELAQDLAKRLELNPAQVGAWLCPVPSVTELGMAALLPGWPEFKVDYAGDEWIITPPDGADNLARKNKRLAWLVDRLGTATVYDLEQWLSTSLGEVDREVDWIVVTSTAIDAVGEGAGTVALHTSDSLLGRLEQGVRRLLAVGCTEIHVVTDHGFLLQEAVREADKVKKGAEGILKKQARYLLGRDLPPTDLPSLPVSGSRDLMAWFPRGVGCFVTRGPYNYMHGGIALQEVVVPHIQLRRSVVERLVGVALELADGSEIRNAIFKVRLVPEGADLLAKSRQVEIDIVKGEQRVSRVWQEQVAREVKERSLMLEPDYGLMMGDEVRVRCRDSITGELLAEQPAVLHVDLEL